MLSSKERLDQNLQKLTDSFFSIGFLALILVGILVSEKSFALIFLIASVVFTLAYISLRKHSTRILLLVLTLFLFFCYIPVLIFVKRFPQYYFLTFFYFFAILTLLLRFIIFIFKNITLFREKRENLIITAKHEHANRLLGKIARSLIHDVSTPVSVLSLGCEFMKRDALTKKEYREIFNDIDNAVNQIVEMLNSTNFLMKDYSCQYNLEKFNAEECVKSIISLSKHRISRAEISVIEKYTRKKILQGNRSTFLRIVGNIFLNALEELEKKEKDKKIFITTRTEGKYFVIDISDTGKGINPDIIEVCQERYFISRKCKYISTGLAFVEDSIKEVFNGYMKIKKEKDGKNTVSLYFLLYS